MILIDSVDLLSPYDGVIICRFFEWAIPPGVYVNLAAYLYKALRMSFYFHTIALYCNNMVRKSVPILLLIFMGYVVRAQRNLSSVLPELYGTIAVDSINNNLLGCHVKTVQKYDYDGKAIETIMLDHQGRLIKYQTGTTAADSMIYGSEGRLTKFYRVGAHGPSRSYEEFEVGINGLLTTYDVDTAGKRTRTEWYDTVMHKDTVITIRHVETGGLRFETSGYRKDSVEYIHEHEAGGWQGETSDRWFYTITDHQWWKKTKQQRILESGEFNYLEGVQDYGFYEAPYEWIYYG